MLDEEGRTSTKHDAYSAYEKALEAAQHVDGYPTEPWGSGTMRQAVNAFLAALPPSIVVDGRVVELSNGFAWHKWAMDAVAGAGRHGDTDGAVSVGCADCSTLPGRSPMSEPIEHERCATGRSSWRWSGRDTRNGYWRFPR